MKKEEKQSKRTYDLMAKEYHSARTKKRGVGQFYNKMLEMPATLELSGNVKNKKVLDWGCGSGIYAKILTRKGAKVKGFDISEEMVKIAKKENPKLDLRVGSGLKIPFKEKFDIVVASLAIHYLKDWDKVFEEVKKILKKGGIFVYSVGNPIVHSAKKVKINGKKKRVLGIKSYFRDKEISAEWKLSDNKKVKVITYLKTYEEMINFALKNNFEIVEYKDTFPLKKSKKLFPKEYELNSKIPFFCVWKLRKK